MGNGTKRKREMGTTGRRVFARSWTVKGVFNCAKDELNKRMSLVNVKEE